MSIIACSGCGQYIDTDFDTEAWCGDVPQDDGVKRDIWLCGACRDNAEWLQRFLEDNETF